jgi:hypothetical protein
MGTRDDVTPSIFKPGTDGGEWSASRSSRFNPSTHCIISWIPSTKLVWKERNLLPLLGIQPQFVCHPAYSLVTILTVLSQLRFKMVFIRWPRKSCTFNQYLYASCTAKWFHLSLLSILFILSGISFK